LPDYPNKSLASGTSNPRPLETLTDDKNDPVILLAFSGGGSRAAALGLSILDELASLSYSRGGKTVRLIDRVRVVSSVSGGSVASAWFSLVGPDHMDDLKANFLEQDNMATLIWTAADPITWFRLTFSSYKRIDALRDILDRKNLFDGKTFAALRRPGAPLLILNATDMGSGEVFSFTPQRFDDICSDLSSLPISVGVAASAAFPVALSPMNLKNFAGSDCPGAIPRDEWIEDDLKKVGPRYLNVEEFKRARYADALRRGKDAFRSIEYLHLLDGGLADNQGAHSLMETLISTHGPVGMLNAINEGKVKNIVVIAVNARSDQDNGVSTNAAVPGLFSVISAVTGVPIDSTTAYSNASLQLLIDTLSQAGADAKKMADENKKVGDPKFVGLKVYGISIDFDQFRADQNGLRDRVKTIGTSWNLSPQQLNDTLFAGKTLLEQHPCFQRLLTDMGVSAAFVDPGFAQNFCILPQP
jgi:NTE family protein